MRLLPATPALSPGPAVVKQAPYNGFANNKINILTLKSLMFSFSWLIEV